MASRQKIQEIQVNEGNDYTLPFVPDEDLSGTTLSVRILPTDGSGTGTEVATASGAGAGTQIDISLALSAESPDEYNLEIKTDSDQVVYPNPPEVQRLIIRDRFSVTN